MTSAGQRLRSAAGSVTPAGRRWSALLRSLDFDPMLQRRALAPPGPRDYMICGSPRSGTTLLAAMLWQPPHAVTVAEPWDGLRLPPADLFRSLRHEMLETGRLTRGRLDITALTQNAVVEWQPEGSNPTHVAVDQHVTLGVKWPTFWQYLDLLPETKFLVCLRHPYEVIASYASTGGRLALGLDYNVRFNHEMNTTLSRDFRDPAIRRVQLYDYIYSRILPHLSRPNVMAVRYEAWFDEPAAVIDDIAAFLGVELHMPNIELRAPHATRHVDDQLQDVVSQCCKTAPPLGYTLA